MTNLEVIKTKMLDRGNDILTDEEYTDFLRTYDVEPSQTYLHENLTLMMLIKAEILETIVSNPSKWNSYKQGRISETVPIDMIAAEAQKIRKRYTKVV